MVAKYVTVVLHSSSRADGNTTNIGVRDVFIVQIFFYWRGLLPDRRATITVRKTRTVSENVQTADFTHLIIQIADGPDTCIFP